MRGRWAPIRPHLRTDQAAAGTHHPPADLVEGHHRQGRLAALMAANRAKQRRTDWSAKLTRSLTLKDGTKLVTLDDARAWCLRIS
jgi:hypothetical protein